MKRVGIKPYKKPLLTVVEGTKKEHLEIKPKKYGFERYKELTSVAQMLNIIDKYHTKVYGNYSYVVSVRSNAKFIVVAKTCVDDDTSEDLEVEELYYYGNLTISTKKIRAYIHGIEETICLRGANTPDVIYNNIDKPEEVFTGFSCMEEV